MHSRTMVYLRSLDDQTQIPVKEGDNLLLGRHPICDIEIDDTSVSSQHARLQLVDNHLRIVDMDSTNGTRINYTPLSGNDFLLDGDTVEFGNVTFTVDGPRLEKPAVQELAPEEENQFQRLESSQALDATMMNIVVPTDEELAALDDTIPAGHPLPEATQPTDVAREIEQIEKEEAELAALGNPLLYSSLLSLLLLLLASLLILGNLSKQYPPPAGAESQESSEVEDALPAP